MAQLSIWLPPFSPDYSGASAVLFDLNTITAMHDAAGCTGNYTGYDDPRWYGSQAGIFCSGLREIDAVLGDDEKLENKMIAAAKELQPELLAIVGSPVPMVIGSDLQGIARELEDATGIPSFGFDTTGLKYYDDGAYKAARALIDRFMEPPPSGERTGNRVNIVGALPMDFAKGEEIGLLRAYLEERGYEITLCLAMGYTLETLKRGAEARVNLAVSRFGYRVSRYLEEKYGIPWLCGFPVGEGGAARYMEAFSRVMESGRSETLQPSADKAPGRTDGTDVLIIGEQVMSNAIRVGLLERDPGLRVRTGCIYGMERTLALEGDLDLISEAQIREAVNAPDVSAVIADPFMEALLERTDHRRFLPFAQYAVSSKLGLRYKASILEKNFDLWLVKSNQTPDEKGENK